GSGPAAPRRMLGGQTVRHERRLTTPTRAELALERTPGEQALDLRRRVPGADAGRMALKLSLLLEVSKALSGTFVLDLLLQRVVDFAFQLLEVDRVALLLMRDGELVPQVTREAAQGKSEDTGDATGRRAVPRSIVEHA